MNTFTAVVAVAAAASLLAACGKADADRTEGPAVSAAEAPVNTAVDTTSTTGETTLTPGANSFTEAQARGAIEKAGYSNVGPLSQSEQGVWTGKATRNGTETSVSVDYKGAVAPQ